MKSLSPRGFFNCLTESGKVFDTTKYVWLQGRQVWTYCQLAKDAYVTRDDRDGVDPNGRKKRLVVAAVKGGEFLRRFAKVPDGSGKCYFALTKDGRPVKIQRTMFSESFYALAMIGLADVPGEKVYKVCSCQ